MLQHIHTRYCMCVGTKMMKNIRHSLTFNIGSIIIRMDISEVMQWFVTLMTRTIIFRDIWGYFCFQYYLDLYIMQEPSYSSKIILVSIWFRMVVTQITTRVYIDSLILRYPPNINIWHYCWCWRRTQVSKRGKMNKVFDHRTYVATS